MPTYVFECIEDGELELNVPMAERDNQECPVCFAPLQRKIRFTGVTQVK